MSNTKFTPGPWKVSSDDFNRNLDAGHRAFAIMSDVNLQFHIAHTQRNCRENDLEDNEEDVANAALIASAPDLYEALVELKRWVGQIEDWSGVGDPPIDIVEAALKKANP